MSQKLEKTLSEEARYIPQKVNNVMSKHSSKSPYSFEGLEYLGNDFKKSGLEGIGYLVLPIDYLMGNQSKSEGLNQNGLMAYLVVPVNLGQYQKMFNPNNKYSQQDLNGLGKLLSGVAYGNKPKEGKLN